MLQSVMSLTQVGMWGTWSVTSGLAANLITGGRRWVAKPEPGLTVV